MVPVERSGSGFQLYHKSVKDYHRWICVEFIIIYICVSCLQPRSFTKCTVLQASFRWSPVKIKDFFSQMCRTMASGFTVSLAASPSLLNRWWHHHFSKTTHYCPSVYRLRCRHNTHGHTIPLSHEAKCVQTTLRFFFNDLYCSTEHPFLLSADKFMRDPCLFSVNVLLLFSAWARYSKLPALAWCSLCCTDHLSMTYRYWYTNYYFKWVYVLHSCRPLIHIWLGSCEYSTPRCQHHLLIQIWSCVLPKKPERNTTWWLLKCWGFKMQKPTGLYATFEEHIIVYNKRNSPISYV